MLDRLGDSDRVQLYLVWSFQPVELIESQVFGLDRPDGHDEAEDILSGRLRYRWSPSVSSLLTSEPVRKALPEGVNPGRSAALFRFRRELQDAFTYQDVEAIAGFVSVEDPVHMLSVPRSQWRVMGVRAEDARAIVEDDATPQLFETFEDLVSFARARRESGKPIPWQSRPDLAVLASKRKEDLSGTMSRGDAEKQIAHDLGISPGARQGSCRLSHAALS